MSGLSAVPSGGGATSSRGPLLLGSVIEALLSESPTVSLFESLVFELLVVVVVVGGGVGRPVAAGRPSSELQAATHSKAQASE